MKASHLGKHANAWFLRGQNQNTLKVPVTPDSELLERIKKALGDEILAEGGTTKCVELGGDLITKGLSGSVQPTGPRRCNFEKMCNIEEGEDCTVSCLIYKVTCTNCSEMDNPTDALYIGTSGFSLHKRQLEHLAEIRRQQQSNTMAKHQRQHHPNLQPRFTSKPVRGGMKFNLDRYILEVHLIQENHENQNVVLMNQRSAFGNRGIPRLESRSTAL